MIDSERLRNLTDCDPLGYPKKYSVAAIILLSNEEGQDFKHTTKLSQMRQLQLNTYFVNSVTNLSTPC